MLVTGLVPGRACGQQTPEEWMDEAVPQSAGGVFMPKDCGGGEVVHSGPAPPLRASGLHKGMDGGV